MRVTMLPPIRPRPTKPIWVTTARRCSQGRMWCRSSQSSLPEEPLDARREPAHRPGEVVALQSQPAGAAPAAAQRLEIAGGLGVLQRPEAVRPAGDRDVLGPVVDDDEEAPGRRPALVELAGRVQVAWPVAERRRRLRRVTDR